MCSKYKSTEFYQQTEKHIIRQVQQECFPKELESLREGKQLQRDSTILSLSLVLDCDGLMRVGGRLNKSDIHTYEINHLIIPRKHHIATLLIRHFHEKVKHQGRHITEGALRSGGYWVIGAKRLICATLHECVNCR